MTARDLISASLRLIGAIAAGDAVDPSDASDALASLNDLLDSWSTESLLIPARMRETFPLVPSQATYTMGPGGDFNTARPIRIATALVQVVATTPVLELPVEILNEDQFASIPIKSLVSTYPASLYLETTPSLARINLYPVPNGANNLVLYSDKPLSNVGDLSGAFDLPPGYLRALRFNLAVELAPEYGRAVPEIVAMNATQSKAAIKRMNSKPYYLRADNALLGRRGGGGRGFDMVGGGSSSGGSDGSADGGTF